MRKICGILIAMVVLSAVIPGSAVSASPMFSEKKEKIKKDVLDENIIVLRGKWGFKGDKEPDGDFAGKIIPKNRFFVFKGIFNVTNSSYGDVKGRVFGVLRHGFFNGIVKGANGERSKVIGLYKLDRERKIFKIRWMTFHDAGWALAKITSGKQ